MQENFRLLKSVLERLHKAGCLEHVILIGSWASYLYERYYNSKEYRPLIRTSDVDFLIPNPRKVNASNTDIGEILEDLNFVKSFNRSNGLIKYEREGLTIEFLVPELGRGGNEKLLLNCSAFYNPKTCKEIFWPTSIPFALDGKKKFKQH